MKIRFIPNKQPLIGVLRTQIVSPALQKFVTHCRGCRQTVDLVTFAEASEIVGATVDEIINGAATGMLHVAVRPEAMLVCLTSLLASGLNLSSESGAARQVNQRRTTDVSC